jgi:hypothetical protein
MTFPDENILSSAILTSKKYAIVLNPAEINLRPAIYNRRLLVRCGRI